MRDSCGSGGTGETPQAFTPRRLTARTKESEHLEGKSTTTHYLVNSNKVCENSLLFKRFQSIADRLMPSADNMSGGVKYMQQDNTDSLNVLYLIAFGDESKNKCCRREVKCVVSRRL